MASALSRFITWGADVFAPKRTFGRVPFQPLLYFFLWSAAVRITFNDSRIPDIPFRQVLAAWTEYMWDILAIGCPPLALLAWWMIAHLHPRVELAGHWLRLSADIGMFISLLTYHIATAVHYGWRDDEHIYNRYLTACCVVFILALIIRDVWILLVIDRIAAGIRRGRFK